MSHQVVVTGIGAVSPNGLGREAFLGEAFGLPNSPDFGA